MTTYHCNFDHTKPVSDTCFQANLAANTEQTYTVPGVNSQKYRAEMNLTANANVYMGLNVTAVAPGAGLNSPTPNLIFRPEKPFYVKGGDVIHLVTPDTAGAHVGISLLAVPS